MLRGRICEFVLVLPREAIKNSTPPDQAIHGVALQVMYYSDRVLDIHEFFGAMFSHTKTDLRDRQVIVPGGKGEREYEK